MASDSKLKDKRRYLRAAATILAAACLILLCGLQRRGQQRR